VDWQAIGRGGMSGTLAHLSPALTRRRAIASPTMCRTSVAQLSFASNQNSVAVPKPVNFWSSHSFFAISMEHAQKMVHGSRDECLHQDQLTRREMQTRLPQKRIGGIHG
jgi:hypothetical protein